MYSAIGFCFNSTCACVTTATRDKTNAATHPKDLEIIAAAFTSAEDRKLGVESVEGNKQQQHHFLGSGSKQLLIYWWGSTGATAATAAEKRLKSQSLPGPFRDLLPLVWPQLHKLHKLHQLVLHALHLPIAVGN